MCEIETAGLSSGAMSGCQSSASRAPKQSSQFEVYGMASCQHVSIFLFRAIFENMPVTIDEAVAMTADMQ